MPINSTHIDVAIDAQVYVFQAGYGRVSKIEPAYLGWPPRYEITLHDGETIWRDRREFYVVLAALAALVSEASDYGVDVEAERCDLDLLRSDVTKLRAMPADERAAAVARLNEGWSL